MFAFDLYDTNADGRLSTLETTQMFREILGSKALEQDQMQRVLHKLVSGAVNGYVLEDSWREFSKLHQALLVNVFGVQNKLRITTLGVRCWERISRRKIQIRPGCTVRLSDLMVLVSLYCISVTFSFYSLTSHVSLASSTLTGKCSQILRTVIMQISA